MIITRREAFKIAAAAGASAFGLPLAVTDARAAATVASAADAAAVSVPEAAVASAVDIDDLVARMTLDEKISMVHGIAEGHDIGHTPGVPRLGVPPLRLTDGPCGLRVGPPPTCLPCPAALGATWSRTLSRQFGEVLGREAKYDGQNVMFAPAMNIVRVPQGGRSFE